MEDIFVPALGMAMEEATLISWFKEPGDRIDAGDAVAEIETDKSTLELSATTAGTLGAHRAEPGQLVAVGAAVTVVLADGESESPVTATPPADDDAVAPLPAATATPENTAGSVSVEPVADRAGRTGAESLATPPEPMNRTGRAPHRLSPRQRSAAQAASSVGSGRDGSGRDGSGQVNAPGPAREAIGRLVSRSWAEIPHFAVARVVDADGVLDRTATEPQPGPVRVSVTDVLLRSLARSLRARGLSSDLGLAVATPDGVALPVLVGVADRALSEIAQLRRDAVDRARSRRSVSSDTRTPVFTLSNLGTHGVSWFTGIIPFGQQGLLTLGTMDQRPVVHNGRLTVGWRLDAVLNVDHRVWDGAEAAEILGAFADQVQAYGSYADE